MDRTIGLATTTLHFNPHKKRRLSTALSNQMKLMSLYKIVNIKGGCFLSYLINMLGEVPQSNQTLSKLDDVVPLVADPS